MAASGQPAVAGVTDPGPRETVIPARADATGPGREIKDPEPSAAALAAAPAEDQASGYLVPPERGGGGLRAIVNAILWTPRQLLELGLWVPDQIAGRVDDYLESRGPVYTADRNKSRGRRTGWSGGGMLAWEAPFGPSVGAKVGHSLGPAARADLTAVTFGRHGYTGRVEVDIAPRPGGPIEIALEAELAHDRETAFAGIGDHRLGRAGDTGLDPFAPGRLPETILDDRAWLVRLGVPIRLGRRFRVEPSVRVEQHDVAPDDQAGFAYDRAALFAFDDPFVLGGGRLEATYDDREGAHPWIPLGAPSSGWRIAASASYSRGRADVDGDFQVGRYAASVERLVNLFRGTRVLIIKARIEGITQDTDDVPVLLLPSLGGPDHLRAFSRGRFRDRTATSSELAYEWALGRSLRASLFTEVGGVHPGLGELAAGHLHLSSGGSLRFAYDGGTAARVVAAGSETGEWSFFVLLGGV